MTKKKPKHIHLLKVPTKDVYLAFSGGVDSAVLLHRLIQHGYTVTLLNVHHGDDSADEELRFSLETSDRYGVPLVTFCLSPYSKLVSPSSAKETYWGVERNKIFQSLDKPVLTGHHLDDAVEWYVMSTFTGTPKLTEFQNRNVYRPLLLVDKDLISHTAVYYDIAYIVDSSNFDPDHGLRNKVRNSVLPVVKEAFPGLRKTVRRLIKAKMLRHLTESRLHI